jgi:fermentation-respiration switch protein FrsA (DUF1100 family)
MLLRWYEHSRTYHPSRTLVAQGAALGRDWEDVMFAASDGVKLHGWFFPANVRGARQLVVLVCHGNGGNISHRLELCRLLLELGVGVFVFDYRGYGRSEGKPDEAGTYLDAQAAHHWLQQKGFAPADILALGESLGGGVAAELACRETLAGLALQSTFTSLPDVGAELYPFLPVRLLGRIRYDTRRKLPRIHVPVLVMHSRGDRLIRFHHAEQNFAAANEPKLFWELTGDHNDGATEDSGFAAGMALFMHQLGGNS